jgi:hypothetical protein
MSNHLKNKLKSLNSDQKFLFDEMQKSNLLQICIPTGAGKGYLMMADLLNQVVKSKSKIFTISSHRLMLNTQHMNDIFDVLAPYLGEIGFVFVGSSKYDVNKFQQNPEFNQALLKKKLSYNELVSSTTKKFEVEEMVNNHLKLGRKVIILTTYHSLSVLNNIDIDTIYNDEAHTLASEAETAQFRDNFLQVKYKRCFFLTATPKDCDNSNGAFLMNNEHVFGKRIGLNFRECVEKGYIVKPIVHIAMPSNLDVDVNFDTPDNMARFVLETFQAHKEFLKENSAFPEKIAPKMLVKCSSVNDMWEIHSKILESIQNVRICAGASRNDNSNFNHYIDDRGINDRSEYLEEIQNFDESEMAIVLHYDTMSEGINVSGFTATQFLSGKLPTITKTLQNTGRSTRLHSYDRDRLRTGEITTSDYSNWIKPYCAVIIPFWDNKSEFTAKELATQIRELRDKFEFNPAYIVSIGDDKASSIDVDDMNPLNQKDEKSKKVKLVEKINNEIESLDKLQASLSVANKVNNMTLDEWFKLANDL